MARSNTPVVLPLFAVLFLVVGCGGGGGSSGSGAPPGTVVSTSTFALQNGYRARIAAGATDNFTISGSCAGSAQISNSAASATTFESVPGYQAMQSASVTFTNCLPANSTASGTNYYDINYALIGAVVPGSEYAVYSVAPTPLPASVKVGDAADYATLATYIDSSKNITTGKRVLSYAIEADTATTAILDLIAKTYDSGNNPQLEQRTRYRMAEDGTLTLLTIDVQYLGTSTVHLLYTKV